MAVSYDNNETRLIALCLGAIDKTAHSDIAASLKTIHYFIEDNFGSEQIAAAFAMNAEGDDED